MIGAIIGDVIGSVYEWNRTKEVDFPLFSDKTDFTDDTVLTIATAHAIMKKADYGFTYKSFALGNPGRGYGGRFYQWMKSASFEPAYNSYGNGSAMRVSPVGFAFDDCDEMLEQAKLSATCTHNHEEGIKGAQATAFAIFLARKGESKETIRSYVNLRFGYNLDFTIDEIRPSYTFDETCQNTVPQAIVAFLDSTDFESAIRLAISLGGDSDTLACIAGGISEAFYKEIPEEINKVVWNKLPEDFQFVISEFYKEFVK